MILIIGYGNPLRSDDAIGQQIAEVMKERLPCEAIRVITAYQLTPELVETIRLAKLVIFIDACLGTKPGKVFWEDVEPEGSTGAFTHHVTPKILLAAARELYAAKPAGILISIVGAHFDYSSRLSDELEQMRSEIADQVEGIIKRNLNVVI